MQDYQASTRETSVSHMIQTVVSDQMHLYKNSSMTSETVTKQEYDYYDIFPQYHTPQVHTHTKR